MTAAPVAAMVPIPCVGEAATTVDAQGSVRAGWGREVTPVPQPRQIGDGPSCHQLAGSPTGFEASCTDSSRRASLQLLSDSTGGVRLP